MRGEAGKGDTPRPIADRAEWDRNFEAIFGRREPKVWDPDEPEPDPDGPPPDTDA